MRGTSQALMRAFAVLIALLAYASTVTALTASVSTDRQAGQVSTLAVTLGKGASEQLLAGDAFKLRFTQDLTAAPLPVVCKGASFVQSPSQLLFTLDEDVDASELTIACSNVVFDAAAVVGYTLTSSRNGIVANVAAPNAAVAFAAAPAQAFVPAASIAFAPAVAGEAVGANFAAVVTATLPGLRVLAPAETLTVTVGTGFRVAADAACTFTVGGAAILGDAPASVSVNEDGFLALAFSPAVAYDADAAAVSVLACTGITLPRAPVAAGTFGAVVVSAAEANTRVAVAAVPTYVPTAADAGVLAFEPAVFGATNARLLFSGADFTLFEGNVVEIALDAAVEQFGAAVSCALGTAAGSTTFAKGVVTVVASRQTTLSTVSCTGFTLPTQALAAAAFKVTVFADDSKAAAVYASGALAAPVLATADGAPAATLILERTARRVVLTVPRLSTKVTGTLTIAVQRKSAAAPLFYAQGCSIEGRAVAFTSSSNEMQFQITAVPALAAARKPSDVYVIVCSDVYSEAGETPASDDDLTYSISDAREPTPLYFNGIPAASLRGATLSHHIAYTGITTAAYLKIPSVSAEIPEHTVLYVAIPPAMGTALEPLGSAVWSVDGVEIGYYGVNLQAETNQFLFIMPQLHAGSANVVAKFTAATRKTPTPAPPVGKQWTATLTAIYDTKVFGRGSVSIEPVADYVTRGGVLTIKPLADDITVSPGDAGGNTVFSAYYTLESSTPLPAGAVITVTDTLTGGIAAFSTNVNTPIPYNIKTGVNPATGAQGETVLVSFTTNWNNRQWVWNTASLIPAGRIVLFGQVVRCPNVYKTIPTVYSLSVAYNGEEISTGTFVVPRTSAWDSVSDGAELVVRSTPTLAADFTLHAFRNVRLPMPGKLTQGEGYVATFEVASSNSVDLLPSWKDNMTVSFNQGTAVPLSSFPDDFIVYDEEARTITVTVRPATIPESLADRELLTSVSFVGGAKALRVYSATMVQSSESVVRSKTIKTTTGELVVDTLVFKMTVNSPTTAFSGADSVFTTNNAPAGTMYLGTTGSISFARDLAALDAVNYVDFLPKGAYFSFSLGNSRVSFSSTTKLYINGVAVDYNMFINGFSLNQRFNFSSPRIAFELSPVSFSTTAGTGNIGVTIYTPNPFNSFFAAYRTATIAAVGKSTSAPRPTVVISANAEANTMDWTISAPAGLPNDAIFTVDLAEFDYEPDQFPLVQNPGESAEAIRCVSPTGASGTLVFEKVVPTASPQAYEQPTAKLTFSYTDNAQNLVVSCSNVRLPTNQFHQQFTSGTYRYSTSTLTVNASDRYFSLAAVNIVEIGSTFASIVPANTTAGSAPGVITVTAVPLPAAIPAGAFFEFGLPLAWSFPQKLECRASTTARSFARANIALTATHSTYTSQADFASAVSWGAVPANSDERWVRVAFPTEVPAGAALRVFCDKVQVGADTSDAIAGYSLRIFDSKLRPIMQSSKVTLPEISTTVATPKVVTSAFTIARAGAFSQGELDDLVEAVAESYDVPASRVSVVSQVARTSTSSNSVTVTFAVTPTAEQPLDAVLDAAPAKNAAAVKSLTAVAGAPVLSAANAGVVSVSATCTNGVKDGSETDVDCGGAGCPARCATGRACAAGTDCLSGICASGKCAVATSAAAAPAAVAGVAAAVVAALALLF